MSECQKEKKFQYGDAVKLAGKSDSPIMRISCIMPVRTSDFRKVLMIECWWFEEHKPLQYGVFESTELTHCESVI